MLTIAHKSATEAEAKEQPPTDMLFVVWFDTNCGHLEPDWWWEEPGPQTLPAALDMAAQLRAEGWIVRVLPDHQNPRPDGRWDNPA